MIYFIITMKYIIFATCLLFFIGITYTVELESITYNNSDDWDYLLGVRLWPGAWIYDQNLNYTFNNSYWTFHGLWPQRFDGSFPIYCNKSFVLNVTELNPIENQLVIYWTDFINSTQFWIHEAQKHYTCSVSDPLLNTELKFFSTGLDILFSYDIFNILSSSYIYPSNNKYYPIEIIKESIYNNTGYIPSVTCDAYGVLMEIILCYDKNLEIIHCPKNLYDGDCKNNSLLYNIIS